MVFLGEPRGLGERIVLVFLGERCGLGERGVLFFLGERCGLVELGVRGVKWFSLYTSMPACRDFSNRTFQAAGPPGCMWLCQSRTGNLNHVPMA